MGNIIMKYQEQFDNFPCKQGLAIKSKERIELFDISSCQLPTIKLYDIFFIYSELDFFFLDDLLLQIIESISPKASVENSSAQWAILYVQNAGYFYGEYYGYEHYCSF